MTFNADVAERVLGHIEAHPGGHNQNSWRCGTTMCFAGWTIQLEGAGRYRWRYPANHDLAATVVDVRTGNDVDVSHAACDILGIERRGALGLPLFGTDARTVDDLRVIVKELANECT